MEGEWEGEGKGGGLNSVFGTIRAWTRGSGKE